VKADMETTAARTDKRHAKLVLADGTRFDGHFTGTGSLPVWGEVVFNTSMTGYQEVITDPSYAGQIIVMTYPEIGNYGVHKDDNERERLAARALVVRRLSTFYGPGPGRRSLEEFMADNELPGLTGVDTRALTLRIRRQGAVVGVIGPAEQADDELAAMAREKESNRDHDLVASVTVQEPQTFPGEDMRAAVVDFGAKRSIVDNVRRLGVETVVHGAHFKAEYILDGGFDFIVLSNGPGDPTDVPGAIEEVKKLVGRVPILGICLGHQVTALALGGRTYKLKFGHRGANQPVICERTKQVFMTSQNHGYAVADDITKLDGVAVTYKNASDHTLEGFCDEPRHIECVQFHPEASPGPHDSAFIFEDFLARVRKWQHVET
jgi:carbamoyl-phosphate synthase small subunit